MGRHRQALALEESAGAPASRPAGLELLQSSRVADLSDEGAVLSATRPLGLCELIFSTAHIICSEHFLCFQLRLRVREKRFLGYCSERIFDDFVPIATRISHRCRFARRSKIGWSSVVADLVFRPPSYESSKKPWSYQPTLCLAKSDAILPKNTHLAPVRCGSHRKRGVVVCDRQRVTDEHNSSAGITGTSDSTNSAPF